VLSLTHDEDAKLIDRKERKIANLEAVLKAASGIKEATV
jgi:hypothetical protein